MVTNNLDHQHITEVMTNITGTFSKISLDREKVAGNYLEASIQVPKPKSLHWVTTRQRVSRGEQMENYVIIEKSNFPLIF